ncbi:MAG: ribbon-helix-helix protein, CopG family [Gemmatimonadetes bacterium]|nr:ribbon-helix-helix protein, CopG family [Gemmatimonadota bacterium]
MRQRRFTVRLDESLAERLAAAAKRLRTSRQVAGEAAPDL